MMSKICWKTPMLSIAMVMLLVTLADAQLRVRVTEGQVDPIRLALIPTSSQSDAKLAENLDSLVRFDLGSSGLFALPEPTAFLQSPAIGSKPNPVNWQPLGIEAVVQMSIEANATGQVDARFEIWNMLNGEKLDEGRFATEAQFWRRIGHKIADRIYSQLTGEAGYFDSRIVYVSERGPRNARVKQLAIMDTDGNNHELLPTQGEGVMTPRFAPNEQKIAYMSFKDRQLKVFVLDLENGTQGEVGNFKGMTFAPRFDATGTKLLVNHSRGGNADIYEIDLASGAERRLTSHPAIDTSASASPDGEFVVFNSDRGGSQQLYVLNRKTGAIQRISYGDGRYATPVWSPRDDLIAFTKMNKGQFSIGVMRPDGTSERILASSFLDESPVWSPNGRVIMFYRQSPGENGRAELYSVDITGRNLRKVPIKDQGSDPAWSALLP